MFRSTTYIATPPGETIKEQLADRGLTQKEFAIRMNLSEKHISKLINGSVHLTQDVAFRLECVLGIPASFWNNLESIYREKLVKIHDENAMDRDMKIASRFPYNEMQKFGWVPSCTSLKERTTNLRKFFEVTSLELLDDSRIMHIACRPMSVTDKSDRALLAYAQQAKRESRSIETQHINIELLEKLIPRFRNMTTLPHDEIYPQIKTMLLDCGIILIILPHIEGFSFNGVTFYNNKKIIICLSDNYKYFDIFWFNFFHEIAHVIFGHINYKNTTEDSNNNFANEYSNNILIDENNFQKFIKKHCFTKQDIMSFASDIGIDPGIVIGRLQKEGYIPFSTHNELRKKYAIA